MQYTKQRTHTLASEQHIITQASPIRTTAIPSEYMETMQKTAATTTSAATVASAMPTSATSAATTTKSLFIPGPTTGLRQASHTSSMQQHSSTPLHHNGPRRELFQDQHISPVPNDFRYQMVTFLNRMTKVMVYYIHPKLHQDFLMDMYACCNRNFGLNLNFCVPVSEVHTHK